MDNRIQKVQESLVKGIILIARLMGTTGEVLEKEGTMPSPDEVWKGLSFWSAASERDGRVFDSSAHLRLLLVFLDVYSTSFLN